MLFAKVDADSAAATHAEQTDHNGDGDDDARVAEHIRALRTIDARASDPRRAIWPLVSERNNRKYFLKQNSPKIILFQEPLTCPTQR